MIKRYSLRFLIICFHVVVCAFFLYMPKITNFFFAEKSLNIYAFLGLFSQENIKRFEEENNIKVNLKFFETNEELFTKFKINGGQDYDVITSSDYMIEMLNKSNFLLPLSYEKLPVFESIDERILNQYFDPNNRFSIPITWTPLGILFKRDIFVEKPKTLGLGFVFENFDNSNNKSNLHYKMSMRDDYRESFLLGGIYLFNKIKNFTNQELNEITNLLINQKKHLESYLSQDIEYFFSSNVINVAITDSTYAQRVMRNFDGEFVFLLPKEGSLLFIENFAISVKSKNIDLAHKFINFMLSKDVALSNSKLYGLNPSNRTAYELIDEKFLNDKNFFPDEEFFAKLHIVHNDLPVKKMEELWLKVKSF